MTTEDIFSRTWFPEQNQKGLIVTTAGRLGGGGKQTLWLGNGTEAGRGGALPVTWPAPGAAAAAGSPGAAAPLLAAA